jgi:hypothetical protein
MNRRANFYFISLTTVNSNWYFSLIIPSWSLQMSERMNHFLLEIISLRHDKGSATTQKVAWLLSLSLYKLMWCVRSEFSTSVTVFWHACDSMYSRLIDDYWRFRKDDGGPSDDAGSTIFKNIGTKLSGRTSSHLRRQSVCPLNTIFGFCCSVCWHILRFLHACYNFSKPCHLSKDLFFCCYRYQQFIVSISNKEITKYRL